MDGWCGRSKSPSRAKTVPGPLRVAKTGDSQPVDWCYGSSASEVAGADGERPRNMSGLRWTWSRRQVSYKTTGGSRRSWKTTRTFSKPNPTPSSNTNNPFSSSAANVPPTTPSNLPPRRPSSCPPRTTSCAVWATQAAAAPQAVRAAVATQKTTRRPLKPSWFSSIHTVPPRGESDPSPPKPYKITRL